MARKIFLYDNEWDCIGCGSLSASNIQWQLADANGEDIEVHISSGGGSAFDGLAIYNLLANYPGKVTTINDALAGSAAAIILMAGTERKMAKYSLMMIHKASVYAGDGNATALEKTADMLIAVDSQIKAIYVANTGLPEKTVEKMLEAETWMTPDAALAAGFITSILDDESIAISNKSTIGKTVNSAPTIYQSVFNKILTKPTPDMEDHTKQVEANTNLLTKVWNRLKSFNKKFGVENSMIHATDLAVGNAAFSDEDLESPAPDNVYVQDKKKITVKDGIITNMDDEEEDLETDLDEIENIVTNKTPYKVENHAKVINHVVEVQNKLKQAETDLAETRALLTDARENLQVSNIALKRTEEEIRASIKSEFEPDGSKRSQRSTVSNRTSTGVVDKKEDLTDEAVMPKSDLAQNMLKRSK